MGKGTTIAPSLVGVTGKFGQEQLEALLRNPNPRMRAGHMPAVDAPAEEMSALIAYLGVLGTPAANTPEERQVILSRVHLNADTQRVVAKKVDLVATAPLDPKSGTSLSSTVQTAPLDTAGNRSIESIAAGQKLFLKRGCFTCHGRGAVGGLAPALAPFVSQLSDSQLKSVLENPTAKMKDGGMPPVQLTSEEMEMLLSYLRTLPNSRPENQSAAKTVAP
jgi:mono/diheme cytochrome c family protein